LKTCVIAISRNPNSLLEKSIDPKGWHFDARCFLGSRLDSISNWNIKWFRVYNLDRYSSQAKISKKMRSFYLTNLDNIGNSKVDSIYRYNVGDLRFWEGPAWTGNQTLEIHESGD